MTYKQLVRVVTALEGHVKCEADKVIVSQDGIRVAEISADDYGVYKIETGMGHGVHELIAMAVIRFAYSDPHYRS